MSKRSESWQKQATVAQLAIAWALSRRLEAAAGERYAQPQMAFLDSERGN